MLKFENVCDLVPLGKAINIASDIWNLGCIIYHPQFGENN